MPEERSGGGEKYRILLLLLSVIIRAANEPSEKFSNHGEGPYYDFLLVESLYQCFHIEDTILNRVPISQLLTVGQCRLVKGPSLYCENFVDGPFTALVIITLVRCARARVTCVTAAGLAWCPASPSACSASRYHCSTVSTHATPPPCDSDPAPPREQATDTQPTSLEHFVIQFEVEELFFRRFSFVHMNE